MGLSGADLLRMLEPAVRPVDVGAGASTQRVPGVPIEERSFESLLMEAGVGAPGAAAGVGDEMQTAEPSKVNPLAPLSGLGAVESASLRGLIASHRSGM